MKSNKPRTHQEMR